MPIGAHTKPHTVGEFPFLGTTAFTSLARLDSFLERVCFTKMLLQSCTRFFVCEVDKGSHTLFTNAEKK